MRRGIRLFTALGLVVVFLATAASAQEITKAAGTGQTKLSAAFGFTAFPDLEGEFQYNQDPQQGDFSAHCDEFTSWNAYFDRQGNPVVELTATCLDKDDVTVYLFAKVTDKGEPGIRRDCICIAWNYTLPALQPNSFIKDMGKITAGNIQIDVEDEA
jgi:hypothetical protein